MDEIVKKVPWYQKKEYYAITALILGGVQQFTPPHTVAHQLSNYLVTVGLPLTMGYFGISDAKKYGTPSGLSKMSSKVSDAFKNSTMFKK